MTSWYVTVRVVIDETICDPAEAIDEMDYSMVHPAIKETEIVDATEAS